MSVVASTTLEWVVQQTGQYHPLSGKALTESFWLVCGTSTNRRPGIFKKDHRRGCNVRIELKIRNDTVFDGSIYIDGKNICATKEAKSKFSRIRLGPDDVDFDQISDGVVPDCYVTYVLMVVESNNLCECLK